MQRCTLLCPAGPATAPSLRQLPWRPQAALGKDREELPRRLWLGAGTGQCCSLGLQPSGELAPTAALTARGVRSAGQDGVGLPTSRSTSAAMAPACLRPCRQGCMSRPETHRGGQPLSAPPSSGAFPGEVSSRGKGRECVSTCITPHPPPRRCSAGRLLPCTVLSPTATPSCLEPPGRLCAGQRPRTSASGHGVAGPWWDPRCTGSMDFNYPSSPDSPWPDPAGGSCRATSLNWHKSSHMGLPSFM